jgi:hypothetical protein
MTFGKVKSFCIKLMLTNAYADILHVKTTISKIQVLKNTNKEDDSVIPTDIIHYRPLT